MLPVKGPETGPKLSSNLVTSRPHENKRQKSAAGCDLETKNTIAPEEIFCKVANPKSDR
jgi:hypothetical protein